MDAQLDIEAKCNIQEMCILSYSLEYIGWECTHCGTVFALPDGNTVLRDGRHVDWHGPGIAE